MYVTLGRIARLQFLRPLPVLVLAMVCMQTAGLAEELNRTAPSRPGDSLLICPDADGDGWADDESGCDPAPLPGGDCDDGNPAVNPAATESCGDGIDNDCDGSTDFGVADVGTIEIEGQSYEFVGLCTLSDPPGCALEGDPPMLPDGGCCLTLGTKECTTDGAGVVCRSNEEDGSIKLQEQEGPSGTPSCFDELDNDCDGFLDLAEPTCQSDEICNGFDDDQDGQVDEDFDLGAPCDVGVGLCRQAGVIRCTTGGSVECSAVPGIPGTEDTPGLGKCVDAIDNDCDGAADLDDLDCQAPELCDGLDNDGDGLTDEDFERLGESCDVGIGMCLSDPGTIVCSADGLSQTCNAIARTPRTEGPAGATCTDGTDNDCDGLVDQFDPGCASANITALCSLPYLQNGPNGASCEGWHRVEFDTFGGRPDARVIAELLAVDADGTIMAALPVSDGEIAQLKSRTQPNAWRWRSRPNPRGGGPLAGPGNVHEVVAPIPVLHVRVDDGLNRAEAFCSPVPYVQVIRPDDTVVDGTDDADVTDSLVALPGVSPGSLAIKIDGIDVLDRLGIDPATTFPGTHPGGIVEIAGRDVEVFDIAVDVASSIDMASSNTLRFKLGRLGCGGHTVVVDGGHGSSTPPASDLDQAPAAGETPHESRRASKELTSARSGLASQQRAEQQGSEKSPTIASSCHADDRIDRGVAMVFALNMESPEAGSTTTEVPVPVAGEACHGRAIVELDVNGSDLDTSALILEPGDGEFRADTYRLPIRAFLPQTDLALEIAGMATELGTFDAGPNRLIVSASDDSGERIVATRLFAVAPGAELRTSGLETRDSFALGLNEAAVDAFFAAGCSDASVCFEEKLVDSWEFDFKIPKDTLRENYPALRACGDLRIASLRSCAIRDDVRCRDDTDCRVYDMNADTGPCSSGVCMGDLNARPCTSDAQCRGGRIDAGPCSGRNQVFVRSPIECGVELLDENPLGAGGLARLRLIAPSVETYVRFTMRCGNFWANATADLEVRLDVPKAGFDPMELQFDVPEAALEAGGDIAGRFLPPERLYGRIEVDRSSTGGFFVGIANFFLTFIEALSGGNLDIAIDGLLKLPLEGLAATIDLRERIDLSSLTFAVQGVAPAPEPYQETDKLVNIGPSSVHIDRHGITGARRITVLPANPDPEILATPGYLPTPAPVPTPPVDGAGDVYVVFADDLIDQALSAMTTQGDIKTECRPSDLAATVGELFPDECTDFSIPDAPIATAAVVGTCLGIRAADLDEEEATALCETFDDPDPAVRRVGQATCHGVRGANCNQIPVDGFLTGERALCRQVPALNIAASDPLLFCARNDVPPRFLLVDVPQTSAVDAMLRLNDLLVGLMVDRNGDSTPDQSISSAPSCISDGTDGDCKLMAFCLDLNIDAAAALEGTDRNPRLEFSLGDVRIVPRPAGSLCEGGASLRYNYDESGSSGVMESNPVRNTLLENAEEMTPEQVPEGLDLGGLVTFSNPRLVAIRTRDGESVCYDDLQTTCTDHAQCVGDCLLLQDYLGITGDLEPVVSETDTCE